MKKSEKKICLSLTEDETRNFLTVLDRVEWVASTLKDEDVCPFCYRYKSYGHTEDCLIKWAIKKTEKAL